MIFTHRKISSVNAALRGLFCGCIALFAMHVAQAQDGDFEASVLPTLIEANADRWYRVLPSKSQPLLPPVQRVSYNQPFNLYIFFRNFELDDQQTAAIQYDLVVFAPNGRVNDEINNVPAFGAKVNTNIRLALSQQVPTIILDQSDEPGTYLIEVRATDLNTGNNSTARTSIVLDRFAFDKSVDSPLKFRTFSEFYYADPKPGALIHTYLTQAPVDVEEDSEQRAATLEMLWFYRVLFTENKWQKPIMEAAWEDAEVPERKKLIVLYKAIGEDPPPLGRRFATELRPFAEKIRSLTFPDAYGPPQDIRQVGMLWAEFYALGKIQPVERIVALMENSVPEQQLKQFTDGKLNQTPELRKKMLPALIAKAAYDSLDKHCREHRLVRQYCEYIITRDRPKSEVAFKQLAKLLANLPESKESALKIKVPSPE